MIKDFTLNREEVQKLSIWYMFRIYWWIVAIVAICALSSLVVLINSFIQNGCKMPSSVNEFVIFGGTVTIAGFGFFAQQILRSQDTSFGELNEMNVQVEFTDEILAVTKFYYQETPKTQYSYSSITKTIDKKDYFIIFFGKQSWVILPKSYFTTDEMNYIKELCKPQLKIN